MNERTNIGIEELLTKYMGIYEEPSPISNTTNMNPDGPFMGNGTTLAFLGGDRQVQKVYIGRKDMWQENTNPNRAEGVINSKEYTTFGGLTIQVLNGQPQEKAIPFRMEEDMFHAQVRGQSEKGFCTKSWLSARENLLVTEIKNISGAPLDMRVSVWAAHYYTYSHVTKDGIMCATKRAVSVTPPKWSVNVTLASRILLKDVQITTEGKGVCDAVFSLLPEERVIVVSAVEGGKESEDHELLALEKVRNRSDEESLAAAQARHLEWWKEFWQRGHIRLYDELLERVYFGMLYYHGCGEGHGGEHDVKLPSPLFPFSGAEHTNWQGDYTTNTDVAVYVHPLIQANRLTGVESYANLLQSFWPDARRRAASAYDLNQLVDGTGRSEFTEGIRGALIPTHIGPWGSCTEQFADYRTYWNQPSNASSMLMPLVKYWQYTQEEEFLRDILYPMLKDVADFWTDYVCLEDGKYVVYGCTHEGGPTTPAGRNDIFDLMAIRYMLSNAIEAAKQLQVDEDSIEGWQNILKNLSEYPTASSDGKEYFIQVEDTEYPGQDWNPVTVQGVYYFDALDHTSPQTEKEKVIAHLEAAHYTWDHHRGLMALIRIGYPVDIILSKLKKNYLNLPVRDWAGLRSSNVTSMGHVAVFEELLLQSNEGFIHLFPNWYPDRPAGFVSQRAKGAFLVSAEQRADGWVMDVSITSERGKECTILNPWEGKQVVVYQNGNQVDAVVTKNVLGELYTFQTQSGAVYEVKPV